MAKRRADAKRIVYLWGAGATHAEAQRLGSPLSLLMRDTDAFGEGITTRILKRTGTKAVSSFGRNQGVDIEKVISLLGASGNDDHLKLAEEMRQNYFAELKGSLLRANLLDDPQLAVKLLTMHQDARFRTEVETLCGIITTNHDGLLQVASQCVFGGVNPGFEFSSPTFKMSSEAPVLLQLHGSFTWRFALPLRIGKLHQASQYAGTVWIPPTILKESKVYPYNALAGRAYELLVRECDVLRVVGTSLTQNDWNILSLIFNAQRHREVTNREAFQIELIMPQNVGDGIRRDCAYLQNMRSIGYLTDGQFADYKDENFLIPPESDMANPFAYWLKEKFEFHRANGELSTVRSADVGPIEGAMP